MVFRACEPSDLCSVCKCRTSSRCPRCGRPLCTDHAPAPAFRCEPCEREFERSCKPMIDTDGLCVATPPARTRTWLWLTITALIFCGLGLTVSTDVFFSLLLAGPMSCLAGVEVVRTFSELVHRHRRIEERALRRAFLNERKPFLRLASKS